MMPNQEGAEDQGGGSSYLPPLTPQPEPSRKFNLKAILRLIPMLIAFGKSLFKK
jgi:hypothetical protein